RARFVDRAIDSARQRRRCLHFVVPDRESRDRRGRALQRRAVRAVNGKTGTAWDIENYRPTARGDRDQSDSARLADALARAWSIDHLQVWLAGHRAFQLGVFVAVLVAIVQLTLDGVDLLLLIGERLASVVNEYRFSAVSR